jgi:hypothetical protein
MDVTYYPDGNPCKISLFKTIDSFHFSGRISPNMHYLFTLPRSRRPKPASHREGRVLLVWMME